MHLSETRPKFGKFLKSLVEKYVQNQFRRRKLLLAVTWNCSCRRCWLVMKICTPEFIPLTSRCWCASVVILMRCMYSVSRVPLYSSLLWHSLFFSTIYFDIYLSRFFCWKGYFRYHTVRFTKELHLIAQTEVLKPSWLAHTLPMKHVNPLLPSPIEEAWYISFCIRWAFWEIHAEIKDFSIALSPSGMHRNYLLGSGPQTWNLIGGWGEGRKSIIPCTCYSESPNYKLR